jgi:hypothetical protein
MTKADTHTTRVKSVSTPPYITFLSLIRSNQVCIRVSEEVMRIVGGCFGGCTHG